jgi:hypothetical protein
MGRSPRMQSTWHTSRRVFLYGLYRLSLLVRPMRACYIPPKRTEQKSREGSPLFCWVQRVYSREKRHTAGVMRDHSSTFFACVLNWSTLNRHHSHSMTVRIYKNGVQQSASLAVFQMVNGCAAQRSRRIPNIRPKIGRSLTQITRML